MIGFRLYYLLARWCQRWICRFWRRDRPTSTINEFRALIMMLCYLLARWCGQSMSNQQRSNQRETDKFEHIEE